MHVISSERLPIMMWLDDIEPGAMEQVLHLANLPFAFRHIAIMPDSHQGYGMPIGGVLATIKVVVPNAVGVDIGCGMCAMKTNIPWTELTKDRLKKIMGKIRGVIPVGFNHHGVAQSEELMPDEKNIKTIVKREYKAALKQIGTLGGGNHFIEIQKDQDGFVWLMIHSGSRNIGKQVADYYNKLAVNVNERYFSEVPKKWELAFLVMDMVEYKDYMCEMQYCVDFALANRKLMMNWIQDIFIETVPTVTFEKMINIAHNYAKMEHHFGENVLVHRKGATSAKEDQIGIIPGSQGTKSYIVQGFGNRMSFESCSHGAGRKMGRNEAKKKLSLEGEIKRLDDQGIIHSIRDTKDLDEAAGAYKDIEVVMANQADLVKIITTLEPLAVIKG